MNYFKLVCMCACFYFVEMQSMIKTPAQIPALTTHEVCFFNAVRLGFIGNVIKLMKKRININVQDCYGYTPAMIAAFYDDYEMLAKLIELGADMNIQNIYGHTPLILAAYYGRMSIVELLLQQKNVSVEIKDCKDLTALEWVLRSPYDKEGKIAQRLLEFKQRTAKFPEVPTFIEEESKAPVQNDL